MKLWLISQTENEGYDTYDSAVVAAETEREAASIHPSEYKTFIDGKLYLKFSDGRTELESPYYQPWAFTTDKVKVEYIGEAKEGTESGVIVASFNAG